MPQMAPMSWMMLYLYFLITMMLFIMMIYFNKTINEIKIIKFKKTNNEKNWKW
uniref:ATP synthase 8 n=1 Tax=Clonopsis maroccana TaxID=797526 RepID=A0A0B4MI54_9NEOP|nr:ATP synthase 8 [Clonopsis maroccana]